MSSFIRKPLRRHLIGSFAPPPPGISTSGIGQPTLGEVMLPSQPWVEATKSVWVRKSDRRRGCPATLGLAAPSTAVRVGSHTCCERVKRPAGKRYVREGPSMHLMLYCDSRPSEHGTRSSSSGIQPSS